MVNNNIGVKHRSVIKELTPGTMTVGEVGRGVGKMISFTSQEMSSA